MKSLPSTSIPFGPYELIRRIGAGGMGEVFLAREQTPEGSRALVVKKVLPHLAENKQFVGRFLDEARVVLRLSHPNIARVYAMGEVDGHYYLAMEYVQGKTVSRLSYRLREQGASMPVGIALLLVERLCQGLDYAHDAREENGKPLHLVHRDLSPANVCVSYAGEVKVIDFGAAQSTVKLQETAPRVVIGNLSYMAPEQARKRFVDRRADVYSVGVLLWELLTQRFLPQKGDPVERWRRAAYPAWESPSRVRPELPSSLDALLLQALATDPEERLPTAAQLGDGLRKIRLELAPGLDDADLGTLLSRGFIAEKAAEDALVASVVGAKKRKAPLGQAEEPTDPNRPQLPNLEETLIIPPTALAFEHAAVDAPADFFPEAPTPPEGEDVTDPGYVPVVRAPRRGRSSPTLDGVALSEVGFGVSFGGERTRAESSLVREIQGEESLESALVRQLGVAQTPPPTDATVRETFRAAPIKKPAVEALPRWEVADPDEESTGSSEPTWAASPGELRWDSRASDPEDDMEEPLTSSFDTPQAQRFARIAAVVFVAALLLGFAVVWLLLGN